MRRYYTLTYQSIDDAYTEAEEWLENITLRGSEGSYKIEPCEEHNECYVLKMTVW